LFYYSNDGPFGKRNRPGFPTDMEFVRNFSAKATATAAISSMTIKVPGTPEPSYAISCITDIAIMRYKPGDTILIVISQPATLTVSPQNMVSHFSCSLSLFFGESRFKKKENLKRN
jgi:hypothetical protein